MASFEKPPKSTPATNTCGERRFFGIFPYSLIFLLPGDVIILFFITCWPSLSQVMLGWGEPRASHLLIRLVCWLRFYPILHLCIECLSLHYNIDSPTCVISPECGRQIARHHHHHHHHHHHRHHRHRHHHHHHHHHHLSVAGRSRATRTSAGCSRRTGGEHRPGIWLLLLVVIIVIIMMTTMMV